MLYDLLNDFPLFTRTCLRIITKDGKIEPLILNKAQLHTFERLDDQKRRTRRVRAIILKGRQQGISTGIAARFFRKTAFATGVRTTIMTHQQAATDNLFGMARRYYEKLPSVLKPSTRAESAKELWFDKLDSRYSVATAGSKGTGRSATGQLFHGSELAFWANAPAHMAGIGQIIADADGTEIIFESTANGTGNTYYDKVMTALAAATGDHDNDGYEFIFVPWFWQVEYSRDVPDYVVFSADEREYQRLYGVTDGQLYWRQRKIIDDFDSNVSLFDQEYPATPEMAFAGSSKNAIIKSGLVIDASKRKITHNIADWPVIIGVDPAEYGDDDTAIVIRQGPKVHAIERMHGANSEEIAGRVQALMDEWKPDAVNVDVAGVGTGTESILSARNRGRSTINRVNNGQNAYLKEKYANRGAEMWSLMAEWFNGDVSIPDDARLRTDLTMRNHHYDADRRVVLESKERIRSDGRKSPDSADALSLTFAVGIAPRPHNSAVNDRLKRLAQRDTMRRASPLAR